MSRRWIAALLSLVLAAPAIAQVVQPPPPAEYDAQIRYRIRAARNERIRQYLEMTRALEAAGFRREPEEPGEAADPNAERLAGRLPAVAVSEVLREPRVRAVLLVPAGYALPAGDNLVPVRIDLVGGLSAVRQQLLHRQALERLNRLGFAEKVGYDHHNFTRLFGRLPASALPAVLADLRWQPGGWLTPEADPANLPEPIRTIDPVRLVEVVPVPQGIVSADDVAAPAPDPVAAKLSPDLRALLADEGAGAKLTRLEVIFFESPPPLETGWQGFLQGFGGVTIEGRAGQVITVLAPAALARQFAAYPAIATVRLPVGSAPPVSSAGVIQPADALVHTNLSRLQVQDGRGQGVRLAIIDDDFAGIRRFLGRSLANAKLLDLTAERNANLQPDPIPEDRPGRGTLAALAAARAAPRAELVLIRVAPAAPYQVLTAARALSGDGRRSEAMALRASEIAFDAERLRQTRERLNAERAASNENFGSDEESQKKRMDLQIRLGELTHEEQEYDRRVARFQALEKALFELRGVAVVACNPTWTDGWPADGFGALAAFLDGPARSAEPGRRAKALTWLQAAGDTRGQAWAGPMRDSDGNGVLEFAQRDFPLPVGRWTRELNFLGWQPHEGPLIADLPAGARVRLALQWTEAQDAAVVADPTRYRTPLNRISPLVLRQRDPAGRQTENDDLVVVARASALPMLINRTAGGATFEQVIEWVVGAPGRYAVRVEIVPATGTAPAEVALVPAARSFTEIYPRLSVAVLDGPSQGSGRPLFVDFRSAAGGTGTPGDAHAAVVIGAVDIAGLTQPYSAAGTAPPLALNVRPSYITFDEFRFGNVSGRGTANAAGFAAGTVAAMLSAGGPPSADLRWLDVPPGGLLHVPAPWLDQLLHTTGLREREAVKPHNR